MGTDVWCGMGLMMWDLKINVKTILVSEKAVTPLMCYFRQLVCAMSTTLASKTCVYLQHPLVNIVLLVLAEDKWLHC